MKIEDSRFPKTPSVIEKLQRTSHATSFDALEDPDLSFLDLLTSTISSASARPDSRTEPDEASRADEARSSALSAKAGKARAGRTEKAAAVSEQETDEHHSSSYVTTVDQDMTLLRDALTPVDQDYLKQAVIPGLPILMGSVPIQSVFPTGRDGDISYKGFDVSPGLAELIRKGYQTGRPIRVELDEQSAVVLKIRNGRVSAEFISAEKAGFFVSQRDLDELRGRMASRNLPVGTLEYKQRESDSSGRRSREEDTPPDQNKQR